MISRQSILTISAAFCLRLPSASNAFQTNVATPVVVPIHRQPQRTATALRHNHQFHIDLDRHRHDNACENAKEDGRRQFLKQFSSAIIVSWLSPLLSHSLAFAEEDTGTITLDEVQAIIKDESELDAELLLEEEYEKKSIQDEKQLIDDLEKEVTLEESDASTQEEVEEEVDKVKGETEALIKEEEQLKSETEAMITKIETLESEVLSLGAGEKYDNKDGPDITTEKISETFVDKLKERVEQKEDLITRLKRESERDIDPKTGKFRTMTTKEYKERAKSTDVDFIQFLKDTVANEQEWERDLEAFEGFLDREFSPAVKELSKDLKPIVSGVEKDLAPLVKEVEYEIRKDVAPAIGDAMQQLKNKAGMAAGADAEDLKQRAGDLIGKIRSIF